MSSLPSWGMPPLEPGDLLADARDWDALSHKRKAIYALFPYAVRQERDKEYAILDALLHAAKTARSVRFSWYHIRPFLDKLFDGTSHVSSKRAPRIALRALG